jgi:hypothetical protein
LIFAPELIEVESKIPLEPNPETLVFFIFETLLLKTFTFQAAP